MNQVKAGATLNYLIIGFNALVGLTYTPYMLRCLGQNEYGLYMLVASIISYLTLLDFGFGPAVVRYTAQFRAQGKTEEQHALFGLFFRLYSIIGIIAFAVGLLLYFNVDWLFEKTMTPDELSQARVMLLLLLVNLAITFPMSIFGSIIQAYEKFVFQKSVQILRLLLCTAVLVAVLKLGYKAIALVVVQTLFNILLLIANYLYSRIKLKARLRFTRASRSFIREILGFSIWVFLGDVMFKFYYSTGQFVLGNISGTKAVAIFALGITLMQMYILFSNGIAGVLLPRFTAMVARKISDSEIAALFRKAGRLQFFILSLILSGFIIFGQSFITFWAGDGYDDVYAICLVLFASTLVPLIQNTAIIVLQARNQQRWRSMLLVIVSVICFGLQYLFGLQWGPIGCAVAIALGNIIGQGFILNWYYHTRQRLEIDRFWADILRMAIAPLSLTLLGLAAIQVVVTDTPLKLITGIILYLIIFLPVAWRFSLIPADRAMIAGPLASIFRKSKSSEP